MSSCNGQKYSSGKGDNLTDTNLYCRCDLAMVRNALHERGENLTDTSLYCRSRALAMVRNALQDGETTLLILTFTIDLELLQWSEILFRTGRQPYLY